MPRWVRNTRLIALVMLSTAVLSITIIALAQAQVQPRPFMTLTGQAYEIDYYNITTLPTPTLVIHGYMNGIPAPFTVSLFAITPRRIYTVGYYYGVGTVSINLTNAIMSKVANTWLIEYGGKVMPSLMAFITYGSNNETWTVITAIPYNPSWVIERKPIEISINAEFNKVRPDHVIPLKGIVIGVSTQTTQARQANGSNDPFGFTYVGSCSSSSNIAYPPNTSVSYVWVLEQCSEFEGGVPLVFVGWSANIWGNVSSIVINDVSGEAQSGSGLFGVLNKTNGENSNLILVGPTYTFSGTYNIEMSNEISGINITYGPLNEEVSNTMLDYTVPGGGFFYIGLPSYVAYVAFQLANPSPFGLVGTGVWANGTETLAPLPSDISGQYLFVYPYLDIGNGSMTGSFLGIIYTYVNYGSLLINLDDSYTTNLGGSCYQYGYGPQPYLGQTGNQYYIEYTLSSITTAYSPNPIGWAFLFGSLVMPFVPEVAAFFGLTLPDYLGIGLSSALTIAGAFVNTALFNKNTFGLSANVYINYPSLGSSIYITLIGSPEVESTSGSESLYPMGMIVNSSSYYNMGELILGMQCNT